MCKDSPDPDPLIGQAAKLNAETAKEALDFYRSIYASDLKPMQERQAALSEKVTNNFLADSDQQRKFAADQKQYYESTFQPIEKKMAQEAMDYDSDANVNRRMGIASAAANQQYSNARSQSMRELSRYGINPNSSAFANANAKLIRDQALASAGMQTGAAFDTQDKAIALRAGVSNFGRNMPNTAAQYYGLSAGSNQGAMNATGQALAGAQSNAATMNQGFQTNIQGNQSAATIANMDYQGRLQAYNSQMGAIAGLAGAAGTYFGMKKADGGPIEAPRHFSDGGNEIDVRGKGGAIKGPGTGISDDIPAKLSNGEYVIPADVVEAKGVEFFDKLLSRYHTPAKEQRMGLRRAS